MPSVRSRLVSANARVEVRAGRCAPASAVSWWTTTSGSAPGDGAHHRVAVQRVGDHRLRAELRAARRPWPGSASWRPPRGRRRAASARAGAPPRRLRLRGRSAWRPRDETRRAAVTRHARPVQDRLHGPHDDDRSTMLTELPPAGLLDRLPDARQRRRGRGHRRRRRCCALHRELADGTEIESPKAYLTADRDAAGDRPPALGAGAARGLRRARGCPSRC